MKTELVRVTQELIEQGKSGSGGWNRAQLMILLVPWPPRKGWRRRIENTQITKSEADRFVALRGVTREKRNRLSELLLNLDAD